MSKRTAAGVLAIAAMCFLLNISLCAAQTQETPTPQTIRVGYFSFSGFQEIDEQGRYSGYGYEYLQEIAKYTGWEYEYVVAPWDQCQELLQQGKIDLLGSMQYTEQRAQVFDFPKLESGTSYAVLCALANNMELAYEDFEAFDGMRVGMLEGNAQNEHLEEYCKENNFSVIPLVYHSEETLLNALQSGEVDTILTNNLHSRSEERMVAQFAPSPIYFVTTKGNTAVVDQLNYAQTQIELTTPRFEAQLHEKYYAQGRTDQPIFTLEERAFLETHKEIRVAYRTDCKPLEYRDAETGEWDGIVYDTLAALAKSTGISFSFVPVTSTEEAVALLNAGEVDIIGKFSGNYTLTNYYNVTLTNPYLRAPNVMVTNPKYAGQAENFAAVTPDFFRSYLQTDVEQEGTPFREYATVRDAMEALYAGKVTAAYANTYIVNLLRSEYRYSYFHVTATPKLLYEEVSIALPSSANPVLLSILNKAIQFLRDDELDKIVVENTRVEQRLGLTDLIYQHPLESIAISTLFLLSIIAVLCYLAFLRTKSNKRIYNLLYIDELTGIWNFNRFRQELNRLLATDRQNTYALIYTDIERFKYLNDTYGYANGDFILKSISHILEESYEPGEIFARVANDNFIALFKYNGRQQLSRRLYEIDDKCNLIPKVDGEYFKLVLSSGVYLVEPNERDATHIIDCANEARKTLKGTRKSNIAFYSVKLQEDILAKREIEDAMERALHEGQFITYYQPKVDLQTLQIVGAEALVRWKHPQRGLIPPSQFVPLFEQNGFIVDVDFYIFEQVCATLRRQIDKGRQPVVISSNFSRLHFSRHDFITRIAALIQRYQVPPELLELEITESAVGENREQLIAVLEDLRRMGVSIAMDDFGTGYSSLNLLKNLPINTLKLDKDFLQEGFFSERERVVIEGFVQIAHKLHLCVVCEGVETEEQADFLRHISCEMAQGYLYAKPMPLADFETKLFG